MKIFFTSLLVALTWMVNAQNHTQFCNTYAMMDAHFAKHPEDKIKFEQGQATLKQEELTLGSPRGTVYYIPIVFHIIHESGEENLSDDQIYDALRIINEDFRKQNADVNDVVPAFRNITADIEIEFRLAKRKPSGDCFSGITRTFLATSSVNDFSDLVNAVVAQHGVFPGDEYLNVFVAEQISNDPGVAGFTFLPGSFGTSMSNGVFIRHEYVGSIGTGTPSNSRALTHEAGHWLNLPHPWGNTNNPGGISNCQTDDGVSDTPLTAGWTTCNLGGTSCGSLDNVENYMEYSYCSKMFTLGQASRMRTAIQSLVGNRRNVISASNHAATGIDGSVICEVNFEGLPKVICPGDTVQLQNRSSYANTYTWAAPGGMLSSTSDFEPYIVYNNPGSYSVSLSAAGNNTLSLTKNNLIHVMDPHGKPHPYSDGFTQSSFDNDWFPIHSTNENLWSYDNTVGSSANGAVKLDLFNADAVRTHVLESSSLDLYLVTGANLSFQYSFAKKNTPSTVQDILSVYFSDDCGKTWVLRNIISGSSFPTAAAQSSVFSPTSGEWRQISIPIPNSFSNPGFRFRFEVQSVGGNNFFLDDVNIGGVLGIEDISRSIDLQVYPNPLQETNYIKFDLLQASEIDINLYDIRGQLVRTIMPKQNLNGSQSITFSNNGIAKGVYLLKINVNDQPVTKKVIVQ